MVKGTRGKKKGYFASFVNDEYGFGVVARSINEAKKLFWNYTKIWLEDNEYIDIRIRTKKNAIIEGLSIGVIDDEITGLKAGMYDYFEGECPICKGESFITKKGDIIGCNHCLMNMCDFYDKEKEICNTYSKRSEQYQSVWDQSDCDPENCKFWKKGENEGK